jgi:porin
VLLNADLGKLGFWEGLSVTVHAEYNFGRSVNGRAGTIVPVNTGLAFPGIEGDEAVDLSSVFLTQKFGDAVSLSVGKMNIIDLASTKPFMGGAGIDAFWNTAFAAPPSGTIPPYLFGAILSVRTDPAVYGLWVYDPNSAVNKTGLERPFADGVTVRGTIDIPITIAGLGGHQGIAASYSNRNGTDLSTLNDELFLPQPNKGTLGIKDSRYYGAYSFDQYLYQSKSNPREGVGLFGQFGISDGNPNRLYWSVLVGIGGVGLIPGRDRDNWGAGFYYETPSTYLKQSVGPIVTIKDEKGIEVFYNFALLPGVTVGTDLQVIKPSLRKATAVFTGLRTVIRF